MDRSPRENSDNPLTKFATRPTVTEAVESIYSLLPPAYIL